MSSHFSHVLVTEPDWKYIREMQKKAQREKILVCSMTVSGNYVCWPFNTHFVICSSHDRKELRAKKSSHTVKTV